MIGFLHDSFSSARKFNSPILIELGSENRGLSSNGIRGTLHRCVFAAIPAGVHYSELLPKDGKHGDFLVGSFLDAYSGKQYNVYWDKTDKADWKGPYYARRTGEEWFLDIERSKGYEDKYDGDRILGAQRRGALACRFLVTLTPIRKTAAWTD